MTTTQTRTNDFHVPTTRAGADPSWDAIATLPHTSHLVRSCTLDHLSSLSHRHGAGKPNYDYRPPVAHLRALRNDGGIGTLVLEEWDYAPGSPFFGLPRSLMVGAKWEEGKEMPPVLVLARLRRTLAASDAFAREGWDWFLHKRVGGV